MGTHDPLHRAVSDFERALPGLTPVLTFTGAGPVTFAGTGPIRFVRSDADRTVAAWEDTAQRLEQIARVERALRKQLRATALKGSRQAAKKRREESRDTTDAILTKCEELRRNGAEERSLATLVTVGLKEDREDAIRDGDPRPPRAPSERTVRRVLAKTYGPAADRRKDA